MWHMQTDRIKIDKHFPKNLCQYFADRFGSDGSVVKGLNTFPNILQLMEGFILTKLWSRKC